MFTTIIVLLFLLPAARGQQKIDLVEYSIDTVPEYGKATAVNVSSPNANISNLSFAANISSVADGIHTLYLRSRSSSANPAASAWSVTNYQYFFKAGNLGAAISKVKKLEYFIDTDPGIGNAITINVTAASQVSGIAFNPNIAALTNGFHVLYIRSLDQDGKWSITNYQYFYKQSNVTPTVSKVQKLEYFIDNDPGFGKATTITVTPAVQVSGIPFNPNIGALANGFHVLFIRSLDQNGKWSITNYQYFYKQNNIPDQVSTLTKLEYFIDTDPGAGKGAAVNFSPATNVSGLSFNAGVAGIAPGFHVIFIRSRDANGKWSITNYAYFYKAGPQANADANIVKIEYFIDTDPGYFSAVNLPVTPAPDIANKAFSANITGLLPGLHYLNVRSLDSRGKWSVNAFDTFRISTSLPLRLIDFSAAAETNYVNVYWQTSYEENIRRFEIEYSTDGVRFSKIGTENPANSLHGAAYVFKHASPVAGDNFYRLKIIENDGSFSYSAIRLLHFGNNQPFISVYPNPADRSVTIKTSLLNSRISIIAADGKTVQSQKLANTSTSVDVSLLPSGLYTVRVIAASKSSNTFLVVKH